MPLTVLFQLNDYFSDGALPVLNLLLHLYFIQYDSQSSQSYDYVLVADIVRETDDQTFKKQDAYIRNLKLKNIKVTVRLITFTIKF